MTAYQAYHTGFDRHLQTLIKRARMEKKAWPSMGGMLNGAVDALHNPNLATDAARGFSRMRTVGPARLQRAVTAPFRWAGRQMGALGQAGREGSAIGNLQLAENLSPEMAATKFRGQQAAMSNADKFFLSQSKLMQSMPEELRGRFMPKQEVNPITRQKQWQMPSGFNDPREYAMAYHRESGNLVRQQQAAQAGAAGGAGGAVPPSGPAPGTSAADPNSFTGRMMKRWANTPSWGKWMAGAGAGYAGTTAASAPFNALNNRMYDFQEEHPIMSFLGRTFGGMPQYQHHSYLMPSFMQG